MSSRNLDAIDMPGLRQAMWAMAALRLHTTLGPLPFVPAKRLQADRPCTRLLVWGGNATDW